MATFKVTQDYRASALRGGGALVLVSGDTVELDDDVAEFVERDSPGTLTEATQKRQASAGRDRQARGGRNRAAGDDDTSDEG